MKPCINQFTTMQCDLVQFLKISSEVGFKEVELRFPKVEEYLTDYSYKDLKALLRRYGIHVATLNSLEYFSLVPDENFEFMLKKAEKMMVFCQLMECGMLVLVPSKNPHNFSLPEIKKKTVQRLQVMADLGKRYGVSITFEPIGHRVFSIRKALDGLDIVKEVKNHHIALIIDTFNFYVGENVLDDLREVPLDRIAFVHFHDAEDVPLDRITDEHRVFPGEGVIDLEGFYKILSDKGYQGALSVELIDPKLWKKPAKEIVKKAWESLQKYL